MTEALQAGKNNRFGWWYRDSWCADTLCIAWLCMWFERRVDERAMLSNLGTYAFRIRHGPKHRRSNQKTFVVWKVKAQLITVIRSIKRFCSGCISPKDQARSGRPKSVNFKPKWQIWQEAPGGYQASSISHSPVKFITVSTTAKAFRVAKFCLMIAKYLITFDSPSYF